MPNWYPHRLEFRQLDSWAKVCLIRLGLVVFAAAFVFDLIVVPWLLWRDAGPVYALAWVGAIILFYGVSILVFAGYHRLKS